MLWYKTWLETRLRFWISITAVIGLCVFYVLFRPAAIERMHEVMQLHPGLHRPWWFDRSLNDYRFYLWHILYANELRDLWMICAILIGVGGLTQESAKGSTTFTLSLPVRRRRATGTHAAVVCLELLVLAIVPATVLPVVSPLVNGSYSWGEAVCRGLLLACGGFVVFAASFAVSAMSESVYVPVAVTVAALVGLGSLLEPYKDGVKGPFVFRAIDLLKLVAGPPDFSWQTVPWAGLMVSLLLTAAFVVTAIRVIDTRDYR